MAGTKPSLLGNRPHHLFSTLPTSLLPQVSHLPQHCLPTACHESVKSGLTSLFLPTTTTQWISLWTIPFFSLPTATLVPDAYSSILSSLCIQTSLRDFLQPSSSQIYHSLYPSHPVCVSHTDQLLVPQVCSLPTLGLPIYQGVGKLGSEGLLPVL